MNEETPQLEDGYTRLANELFDAILAFPFSSRQLKVLMTVIRKTYGYNKKRDDMSASQIAAVCGIARPHVVKTLGELAEMNVILKQSGKFGSVIEVNKKYRLWGSTKTVSPSTESVSPASTELVLVPNQYHVIPNQYTASTESVSELVPNRYTQKTTSKDNQQKNVASDVIAYLNQKAGRKFEAVPANTKLILARLKEGATVEQLKAVVDAKVRDWLHDPKMSQYLRPATLFNAEKFGQYCGSLGSRMNGSSVASDYDNLTRGAL
ncbi:MAG TPA: conserved phage C-terminal domain-containing protein [Blastocatellia bacterium]|nr:conserved phage C-terminal domain-containing protein [Blastocatellia bacterium]